MKRIILLLTIIFVYNGATGCDICGCFMGITPYDNQSSIGLLYRMRSFNGYHGEDQQHQAFPSGNMKISHGGTGNSTSQGPFYSPEDYEEFRVAELRVRYFLHQRIELNLILPYNFNRSERDGERQQVSGVGDLNVYAGFHVLRPKLENQWQHRLVAGSGIKLPSGSCSIKNASEQRIDLMMQPGTGSTDFFLYSNYMIGYRRVGGSLNLMYKLNGENKYNEAIANSVTAYASMFYKFSMGKKIILIPSCQAYFEKTKGLKVNGESMTGTSMQVLLAGPGLEFFYRFISLHGSFQIPAFEKREENKLGSAGRLILGITFNFNQSNYVIKSKINKS